MAYVYILQSQKNGQYYVGIAVDIQDRLQLHNHGLVRPTKAFLPWKLVFQHEYSDLKQAALSEKAIKRRKSRKYIESLISGTTVL